MAEKAKNAIGKITQIMGAVLDARFADGAVPALNNAIKVNAGDDKTIIAEVAQQLGGGVVRCIAMDSTDGLVRGAQAEDLGEPITVPVGEAVLGRMFNVLGDTIDGDIAIEEEKHEALENSERWPIHRKSPDF
jgi:F-type H+-transporting ATPase subunit beta